MEYDYRPYQKRAVSSVLETFRNGAKSALVVWPTGCGKTVLVSGVIKKVVKNGGKVLFLAHRNRLVEQGEEKIGNSDGITYSTIQSISRDDTLYSYPKDAFNLIVVDETHHIPSSTYQKVTLYFNKARLFGVTATPIRGDGADVSEMFEKVADTYSLPDAIKDGYLCPIKVQTCPVEIDVSDVSLSAGDYAVSEIGQALLPYLTEVSSQIIKKAGKRKTVIFTPLVSTARGMCEIIRSLGGTADYVSGDRTDSGDVLEAYHNGEFQFLLNSMLLTEGYDEPEISCVVNLRLTKSEALMTQIIGRGTRLCPEKGKVDCLVLDFIWRDKAKRKRLSPAAAVMAGSKKTDEDFFGMNEALADSVFTEPTDVFEAVSFAEETAKQKREAALAKELRDAKAKERLAKKQAAELKRMSLHFKELGEVLKNTGTWQEVGKSVRICSTGRDVFVDVKDPVLVSMELSMFHCPAYFAEEPATENQIKALQKFRIPTDIVCSKMHASYLLDGLYSRQKAHLSSYGQIKTLLRYKVPHPEKISAAKAKAAMNALAKNGWRWSSEIANIVS